MRRQRHVRRLQVVERDDDNNPIAINVGMLEDDPRINTKSGAPLPGYTGMLAQVERMLWGRARICIGPTFGGVL